MNSPSPSPKVCKRTCHGTRPEFTQSAPWITILQVPGRGKVSGWWINAEVVRHNDGGQLKRIPMKKVTANNFKKDKSYPRVVAAVSKILAEKDVVTPIEVFVQLDLLKPSMVEDWRFHRIPCLEKAIQCNLSKAGRILRVLRLHASECGLKPSQTVYMKWGKGPKFRLRLSKFGDPNLETAYSTHYLKPHP